MARISRFRVKPFTGKIYLAQPQAIDDYELYELLVESTLTPLGLANRADQDTFLLDDGTRDDTEADAIARTFVVQTVFPLPSVKASVTNGYTGPQTAGAILPPPSVAALVDTTSTRQLVGHPIMVYKIPQIVQVTYPASLAFAGYFMDNYPINRTDFRMVRGIQNEINFYVRDVDRKPVALINSETLTINIVDPATNTLLLQRNLTTIDSTQGIYLLTVLPSEMDAWATTSARWSLSYNRADGSTVLMWTDRAYSPYSTLKVTEGPVPGPAPTVVLTTGDFTTNADTNLYSNALVGASTHGFVGGAQTFMITMTGFSGQIRIDGSLIVAPVNTSASSDWFQVDLQTYTAKTGSVVLNEVGNYLWMRVVLIGSTGTVNQVQYKS